MSPSKNQGEPNVTWPPCDRPWFPNRCHQCDQKRPGCSQCAKIRIVCPGYRDPANLMFRDDTAAVIRKVEAMHKARKGSRRGGPSAINDPSQTCPGTQQLCAGPQNALPPSVSHLPELPSLVARGDEKGSECPPGFSVSHDPSFFPHLFNPSQSLSMPLSDQATYFFFAHYVSSEPPFTNICLKWLSRLYWRESSGQILHSVIESVGLASMANIYHTSDLMTKARHQYGRALAITNEALSDPVEVRADSTIVAILLLGLFEVSS